MEEGAPETTPQTEELDPERAKEEWARQMRKKFTPKDMLDEEGNLNPEYFKPKTGKITVRKWTDKEKDLLIQGIEKHGIGSWAKIQEEFLTLWELSELRVKTARLMGRQSLVQYIEDGWKGNADDVTREYENNKRIGLELNCWKGGVLVNDAAGEVLKILAAEGGGAKATTNGTHASTTKKAAAAKKRSPKQDDEEEADAAENEGEEEEEYQPAPTKRKRNK